MAFINNTVDRSSRDVAGATLDIADRTTQCYLGAAVVGGTAVVGSVGLTTIAAPALTLIPAAVATGLYVYGDHIRNQRANADDASTTDNAPVAA